nr:hypothetical protein GCM10020185_59300 [Pseudomonas brassicacearum subsp. brassicacearum]
MLTKNPIGFQSSTLDPHNGRALEMVVWYPSATTETAQLIADNAVFVGASAVRNAPPTAGEHPLVVLSHGYRGNWSNQIWLASALAQKGYIVAAINHPGSTTHDRSPQAAAQLWQRPVDLRRVIDAVTTQPEKNLAGSPMDELQPWAIHSAAGPPWKSPALASTQSASPKTAKPIRSYPVAPFTNR